MHKIKKKELNIYNTKLNYNDQKNAEIEKE